MLLVTRVIQATSQIHVAIKVRNYISVVPNLISVLYSKPFRTDL